MKDLKIGLALSGGGARGVFHIGVLKAIEEVGIRPSIISGCSAGALIGSLYSQGVPLDEILEWGINTKWFQFLKPRLPDRGITNLDYLEFILRKYFQTDSFETLKIPVHIVATNLHSGQLDVFSSGEIIKPILASCAVPLLFKPVEFQGVLYTDGGIIMNLPCSIIQSHCDFVIGVSLIPKYEVGNEEIKSMVALLKRVMDISIDSHSIEQKKICDLLIESEHIIPFSKFSLTGAKELYNLGYETAIKSLENCNWNVNKKDSK
jgi:NTE family protein